MKKLFYFGLIGIAVYEFLKVYFIMPMPKSQELNYLDFAYFLHTYRWAIRAVLAICVIWGFKSAFSVPKRYQKVLVALACVLPLGVVYLFNFEMSADKMFSEPHELILKNAQDNKLPTDRQIIGVALNGEAKAYPIAFLTYHHQVEDVVGGQPILVTYCSVCRTGRAFEPKVKGKNEQFRLVGMDHFNAMFEDETTKSWWRQVTGECIKGELKGEKLKEIPSSQMTIAEWLRLYPNAQIMQPDPASVAQYDSLAKYEKGKSKGDLTRTDSLSWQEKSWVLGVKIDGTAKAYDWNTLKNKRLIEDEVNGKPIVIALAADSFSFTALQRPTKETHFELQADNTLLQTDTKTVFAFNGTDKNNAQNQLPKVAAYQEFWHSWRTFNPLTEKM